MAAEEGVAVVDVDQNVGNSDFSGSALLIVVGEPGSEEHKDLVIEKLTKGLQSWDALASGIDINGELEELAQSSPAGVEGQNGERLIQHCTDRLQVDILINPEIQSFHSKLRSLLKKNVTYRHIVFAGHVFQGSGSWILQDDRLSFSKFVSVFNEPDISVAIKDQADKILAISAFNEGDWNPSNFAKQTFGKVLEVRLNPGTKLDSLNGVQQFSNFMSYFVNPTSVRDLLKASDVVGNIRFSRPTLYIFPGCQGDSALFGISGFNLLVNGGYGRKACFWDFTRHLDRIDALLLSHLGEDNLLGASSVLERKAQDNVHPELGFVYFNGLDDKQKNSPNGDCQPEDGGAHKPPNLLVDLVQEGNKMIENMKCISQAPHPCLGKNLGTTLQPINLYHKVGHGALDMYVLNPLQDNKEMKEFFAQWSKQSGTFGSKNGIPLPHFLSIAALLVWKPSAPSEKITRILFPGSVPQPKLFEGLDKLKTVDMFKHPECSEESLKAPVVSKTKKTPVAKVAPVQKASTPSRTPRKEKEPVEAKETTTGRSTPDKRKPIAKPGSGKSSKPTKETAKKIDKKVATKSGTDSDTKSASSVGTPPTANEVPSPAESTGTHDSLLCVSEASTAEIDVPKQVETKLNEPVLALTPENEHPPVVDSSPVDAQHSESIDSPNAAMPEVDQVMKEPLPVELVEPEAEQHQPTNELPIEEPAPLQAAPVDTFAFDSENLSEKSSIMEDPTTPLDESKALTPDQKQEQEIGVSSEPEDEVIVTESPESLPDPEQYGSHEFENITEPEPPKTLGVTQDHDDEKDIDTTESMSLSLQAPQMNKGLSCVPPVIDEQQPSEISAHKEGIDSDKVSKEFDDSPVEDPLSELSPQSQEAPQVLDSLLDQQHNQHMMSEKPTDDTPSEKDDLLNQQFDQPQSVEQKTEQPLFGSSEIKDTDVSPEVEASPQSSFEDLDIPHKTSDLLNQPFDQLQSAEQKTEQPLFGSSEIKDTDVSLEVEASPQPSFEDLDIPHKTSELLNQPFDQLQSAEKKTEQPLFGSSEIKDNDVSPDLGKASPQPSFEDLDIPSKTSDLLNQPFDQLQSSEQTTEQPLFGSSKIEDTDVSPEVEASSQPSFEDLDIPHKTSDLLNQPFDQLQSSEQTTEQPLFGSSKIEDTDVSPEVEASSQPSFEDLDIPHKTSDLLNQPFDQLQSSEQTKEQPHFDSSEIKDTEVSPDLEEDSPQPKFEDLDIPHKTSDETSPEQVVLEDSDQEHSQKSDMHLEYSALVSDKEEASPDVEREMYRDYLNGDVKPTKTPEEQKTLPEEQSINPFDGAQPEGLPSPREPELCMDEPHDISIEPEVQVTKSTVEESQIIGQSTEDDKMRDELLHTEEIASSEEQISTGTPDTEVEGITDDFDDGAEKASEQSISTKIMSDYMPEKSIDPRETEDLEQSAQVQSSTASADIMKDSIDNPSCLEPDSLNMSSDSLLDGDKKEGETKESFENIFDSPNDIPAPECNLSSPTNPFVGMSPNEPFEMSAADTSDGDIPFAAETHKSVVEAETLDSDSLNGVPQERNLPYDQLFGQFDGLDQFQGVAPATEKETNQASPNDGAFEDEFDPLKEWGKPMGLPSPAPTPGTEKNQSKGTRTTGKLAGSKTKETAGPKTTASKTGATKSGSRLGSAPTSRATSGKDDAKKPTSSASRMSTGTRKTASAPPVRSSAKENGTKPDAKKPATKADDPKKAATNKRLSMGVRKAAPPKEELSKSETKPAAKSSRARPATVGASAKSEPAPVKMIPVVPFYVDLAYIPHHGDSSYMNVNYFRRVRAKYYVYSALQPDPNVIELLLTAKQTWDDPSLETTVIPTYDTDALRVWMSQNREKLSGQKVDIAPSASRCTIQLQDHETSCAAYRLEF